MGLFSIKKCPIHRIEYSIGKDYMCQQYYYCKKCQQEKRKILTTEETEFLSGLIRNAVDENYARGILMKKRINEMALSMAKKLDLPNYKELKNDINN